jgi:hypothetical protein
VFTGGGSVGTTLRVLRPPEEQALSNNRSAALAPARKIV